MSPAQNTNTWDLIHRERASVADMLTGLRPEQWAGPSICGTWSIQVAAGHILAGAEQTKTHFLRRMATTGFRFNTMIDQEAHRAAALAPNEIVTRLRARTSTTNGPPAPVMTMLGEIVVHGEDVRRPLGIANTVPDEAVLACLDMYAKSNIPVGTKRRIAGIRLVAADLDWSYGAGREVTGPGMSVLLAITGRRPGIDDLSGPGLATLAERVPAPATRSAS